MSRSILLLSLLLYFTSISVVHGEDSAGLVYTLKENFVYLGTTLKSYQRLFKERDTTIKDDDFKKIIRDRMEMFELRLQQRVEFFFLFLEKLKADTKAWKEQRDAINKKIQDIQRLPGPIGPVGPTGLRGDKGEQGEAGINGKDGLKGSKGDRGRTGSQGSDGAEGRQGFPGGTGLPGETGAIGPSGPKGLKGEKGDQGDPGRHGHIGFFNHFR